MRNSVLGIVCLGVLGAPLAAASECYGPVGNSETLWPIALRLRPDPSISPQRMMLALLEANPEAFSRANVNALNAGSTLCFGPGELIGLDEEAAIAVVGRHNREWRSGSEELGAGSNESMPAASGPAGGEEGEPAVVRVPDAVAAFDSRLAQLERRIGDLEAEPDLYPDLDPDRIERALALLEMRVARIEDQVRLLSGWIEAQGTAAGQQAMEPMPTPAPQGDEAMEPMPTPAPQGDEAMEPMPTPAPTTRESTDPEPAAATEERDSDETLTTESVSARIAAWRERVRKLLKR